MGEEREPGLSNVISGSFKFKAEIDEARKEFGEHDVAVLAPDAGWLWLPTLWTPGDPGFRPLPSERHLGGPAEIERMFLHHLDRADFVYLYNPEHYVGLSAAFEIGYALGKRKPIYALNPLDYEALGIAGELRERLETDLTVLPVADAATDFRARFGASAGQG